ncbi:S9 family peptidase [Weeksellaceae bacterium TAE3-ERU29]|nr:S9 family peptidase [Weeksellaceae bacterium TAE3-ERU29]
MKKNNILLIICLLLCGISGFAQQKTLTIEDAVLGYYKGLYPKGLDNLNWANNGEQYVYFKDNQLIFKNTKDNKDFKTLSLTDFQGAYPELGRIPRISFIDNDNLIFRNAKGYQKWNYTDNSKVSFDIPEGAENIDFNEKTGAIAYTKDNNLYIGTEAITDFKDKNIVSGQAIHRSEYGITKGTFWSPKGNLLAFYQKDETEVTEFPLVDLTTTPATAKPIKYPMAGDKSEKAKIGIYNLATKKIIYLDIDTNDYHYLTNLTWSPDEKYVLVAEINRATTKYDLNRYDVTTGKKVNTILTETNKKWVEPENQAVFIPNKSDEFLWLSQKNGFKNIYYYTTSGKLKKQLTKYKWVIKDILGFSNDNKYVIISGTGEDPRNTQTFKVSLRNGKTTNLTPTAGTHNSKLSKDGEYLIDIFSSLEIPEITQIINIKSGKRSIINKSENPLKDYKLGKIDFLELKAEDGQTLYGRMIKPANFDPNKKYPVLVYVYGGPHAQMVTNSFLGGASMWMPAFATLNDYLVFTVDNRGSANRGFGFESLIHRQLGEVEMKDQLVGVDYLKSLPYVDADRLSINGWSYGGFMTTSLMLRHPGIFTVGVAGGPVIDWRMYEVMYGERYMDTPQENPQGYAKNKVSNYIKNLKGKLLIITGSVDPTVVPQHSMSLLKAAVEDNIEIDFFSYPMHEHNVYGKDRVHLTEKIIDYIVTNNK